MPGKIGIFAATINKPLSYTLVLDFYLFGSFLPFVFLWIISLLLGFGLNHRDGIMVFFSTAKTRGQHHNYQQTKHDTFAKNTRLDREDHLINVTVKRGFYFLSN